MTLKSLNTLLDVLHFADSYAAIVVPELSLHVTYDSLRQQILEMANALASAGIRHGDAVAIALPNGLPAIVSFLAASIAGTAAPLNPAYPYEELHFFLGDADARALLVPAVGTEFARSAAKDRKIPIFSVEMNWGEVRLASAPTGVIATEPTADDIALVLHTSGSTGRPKHVPLRHFNLAVSSANIANTYTLSGDDVSLCIMPLFHIHGFIASTMATLLSGGTVVVPAKFNALSFWRTVREHRVTWYSGVPAMHQLLMTGIKHKPVEAHSLRFIRSCGAPLSADFIREVEGVFGVPFVEAYGLTEAADQVTSNLLPPRHRKPGSVGVATGISISIMDTEGNPLPVNQRGEVGIQGANVFRGYENNSKANTGAFVNGWFRTGDEGFLDYDNYLHLTGRIKDSVRYYSCFISYSHADGPFVHGLHDMLQSTGIRCWLDEKQLQIGTDMHEQVSRGIQSWDKVLLCCSEHSLKSWWVDAEINTTFDQERRLTGKRGRKVLKLVPLDLDGYVFRGWKGGKAGEVRSRVAADFVGWEADKPKFETQIQRLIQALRRKRPRGRGDTE